MQNVLEILTWYQNNSRDLPWRATKDPYKIWLSEIILQQTQVNQGLKYYYAFVEQYPDIQSLANADEQEVLRLWQGLGYYSRARNLLKTAILVADKYHGVFPNTMEEILKLPGIGQYTASAILSFAYNLPYPALDGNVFRVLSRLYNIQLPINEQKNRSAFLDILNEMIQGVEPAQFNNAMMELGAMVCKPDNPKCDICPVSSFCLAKALGSASQLPVKAAKAAKKKRYLNFFYIKYNDGFYLTKRNESDIWQNLFQLPLVETNHDLKIEEEFANTKEVFSVLQDVNQLLWKEILESGACNLRYLNSKKHLLTHQEITAKFFEVNMNEQPTFKADNYIWVNAASRQNYPLPILIEKFLLSL
jgi:A/G-specific adenine glycosylase